jgi:teichuronic acid exporter
MANTGQSPIARIALRGTVWVTVGNYAYQVIGFVALLYLRRLLAPEMFGLFDLATFWVALLGVRNKIGLSFAALRQSATDGRTLGTIFVIDLVTGLLGMAIALLAIGPITAQFGYSSELLLAIIAIAFAELITVFGTPATIALEKELQISRNQLVSLASYALGYAVAIGLALAGYRLTSLVSIGLVTAATGVVFSWIMCARRLPHVLRERFRFDPVVARGLLRDGLTTGLTLTLLTTIVNQFDNFLNATFVSTAMQGYYGNAYKIANWPTILLAVVISRVGYNVMTRVKDDKPRLAHTVRLSLWLLCVLGGPLALALGLGADDLLEVLYPGGKWATSAQFLRPLAATSLANTFMGVGYWLSVALGQRRFTVILSVVQAACLLIGGSVLVRLQGINGTIGAVALASLLGFVMSQLFVCRSVALRLRDVFAGPALAAAATLLTHQLVFSDRFAGAMHSAAPALRLLLGSALVFTIFWLTMALVRRQESANHVRYLLRTWRGTQVS